MSWSIDAEQRVQSKKMNDISNFVVITPLKMHIRYCLNIINKEIRMFNNYIAKKRELKLFKKLE
jgi:hypothetical protein